jgi:hypothetical protein
MRLATYNIEWFSSLFNDQNKLINDGSWSSRYNVTKAKQTRAIGAVLRAIDADGIMIIEAPNTSNTQSTVAALEHFARRYRLRQNRAIIGFHNDTQQEIAFLFDPKKMTAEHAPIGAESGPDGSRDAPRFDGSFLIDLDHDAEPDPVVFSKPPLELLITPNLGSPFRMIGVHAKSKAPHGAKNEDQARRISISNRRKQLAQCLWVRQRVDQHLAAGDNLVVMGDFNDGPGLDEYEKLFGHSGIEIVLGTSKHADQRLFDPHAAMALRGGIGPSPTTSRFYNHRSKTYLNALLDYIMVSPDLRNSTAPDWHIWHPFDDPACYDARALCKSLLTASDHFPVTVDLNFDQ